MYFAANLEILKQAIALSEQYSVPAAALLAWEQSLNGNASSSGSTPSGKADHTEEFGSEALVLGLTVIEISTL